MAWADKIKQRDYNREYVRNQTPEQREARRVYTKQWYEANKVRTLAGNKKWRMENVERKRASARAWRLKNAEKEKVRCRKSNRKRLGLPEPTRPDPGMCECCGKPPAKRALSLDHCHTTGAFRGWLCGLCNTAIGKLGDSLVGVMNAVNYLQRANALKVH